MSKDVLDVVYHDEVKRCRIGNVAACLMRDGTITLRGNGLMDKDLRGLTKEDVQDLLVALDAVHGEQPDLSPTNLRETIIGGAHALARDIYRQTAYRAIVDVGLHPDIFYRIASDDGRMDRNDYERGSVRVSPDVELSVAREPARR